MIVTHSVIQTKHPGNILFSQVLASLGENFKVFRRNLILVEILKRTQYVSDRISYYQIFFNEFSPWKLVLSGNSPWQAAALRWKYWESEQMFAWIIQQMETSDFIQKLD